MDGCIHHTCKPLHISFTITMLLGKAAARYWGEGRCKVALVVIDQLGASNTLELHHIPSCGMVHLLGTAGGSGERQGTA